NFPTRPAPSPQIRARDTSLDGTTNGSAGINSAPNVNAGVNSATHLGGWRCRDHEDDGDDSTNDRKLAGHNQGSLGWLLPAGPFPLHQPTPPMRVALTVPMFGQERRLLGLFSGYLTEAVKPMCKVLVEMRGLASLTANACSSPRNGGRLSVSRCPHSPTEETPW